MHLHADVETLLRSDILADLRRGVFDVVIGINLLREGLIFPEVSPLLFLMLIKKDSMKYDKSYTNHVSRASRHIHGKVLMRTMHAIADACHR